MNRVKSWPLPVERMVPTYLRNIQCISKREVRIESGSTWMAGSFHKISICLARSPVRTSCSLPPLTSASSSPIAWKRLFKELIPLRCFSFYAKQMYTWHQRVRTSKLLITGLCACRDQGKLAFKRTKAHVHIHFLWKHCNIYNKRPPHLLFRKWWMKKSKVNWTSRKTS